jgi:hypothetical protein
LLGASAACAASFSALTRCYINRRFQVTAFAAGSLIGLAIGRVSRFSPD